MLRQCIVELKMQVKHPVVEGRGDGAERGPAPANTPKSTTLLYFN
jgi:hypothetical protein